MQQALAPEGKIVNLLLVEDDDIDAIGVERALKRRRIINPLFRARDGIEALEMLRSGRVARPFLILLDLNMPRMGGLEFIREIRDDPALSDTVVFVLTTSKSDEDLAAAYRNHVAGYIVKNEFGDSFSGLVQMLDAYWQIVELPKGR
ncbi:Two-component system response regulator [uncultured Alphaproteobacteria bacterium]|uniref:Two-component system response regulator n=1 Tax=uncultured Alphaproteobacteria bacterium TaxID=91750 RepID=A0A212KM78_9PROT|nr:Two-component system response regulator [uncultured Alphaproteobacteria bacterium]